MSELWLNDNVMVPIDTTSIKIKDLEEDNFADRYVVWDAVSGYLGFAFGGAAPGPEGPTGPTGEVGPIGPQGPAGSGSGNVQGPGSSTFDGIATYNTTNGTLIKSNSIKIIANGEAFQFPPNSGGGVMDFFKYYVSNVNFVTQAPPTTTILITCPVKALRIGHQVTITVGPRISTAGSAGVVGNYITEFVDYLPVEFRPRTTTTAYCRVIDKSFVCLGNLKIDVTGKMTLDVAKVSASFVTDQGFLAFSPGESAGIFETATLSYFII